MTTISLAAELAIFLAAYPSRPFDWRHHNCCHFASAWVKRVTGVAPMDGLADTASVGDALRLVRSLGGSLRAAWSDRLVSEPVDPSFAALGDVVMFSAESHHGEGCRGVGGVVGICCGDTAAVVDDAGCIKHLHMVHAYCTWHIRPWEVL
jgi:hypothetical protein